MKLKILILLAMGLLLLAIAPLSNAQTTGTYQVVECPFDIPAGVTTAIECGYFTVPEDWEDSSNTNVVDLMVVTLSSRSATPLADPIFFLEGGPGGSATLGVDVWYQLPLLDNRDMILFDQRGTGFSIPSLDCAGIDEAEDTEAIVTDCRNNLANQGIDLSSYTSEYSANDVNAMREAFGYDQINLVGISYGTRLGLTIIRDYPEIVRSAVLDSVYPPNINTSERSVPDLYDILQDVFADCAADSACNAAFPDLQTRFWAAVDNIDNVLPQVTDGESGESFELDSATVYGQLYQQFFNGIGAAAPAAFDALANGDYQFYYDLATTGGDMEMAGGGGGAGAEIISELFPEEVEQLEAIVSTGDQAAIVDFFMSLFDGDPADFEGLAQDLVTGVISLDGNMAGAADGGGGGMDISEDEIFEILDSLTDDEFFELEDIILTGDAAAVGNYIASLFDIGDPQAFGAAVIALYNEDTGGGDMDDAGDAMMVDAPENDGDSYGMNLSVQCYEELSFLDLDASYEIALNAGIPEPFIEATFNFNEFLDCEIWNVEAAPAYENDAVVSDIPVLLISGEYDPATPFTWGDLAAETLANGTHFVFPLQGHSLLTAAGSCPGEIAQSFLNNPAGAPDGSCLQSFDAQFFIP